MKTNEAPEKIYLLKTSFKILDLWYDSKIPIPKNFEQVEYTRTDTFIDKACAWLKESITNNPECNRIISKKGVITMGLLIEDFENYMKGE